VLCAALLAGCATANSIANARKQLEAADKAGAKWSAPHEYYAAEEYLKKAVQEAEEGSPRKDVDRFLKKSLDYSAVALQSTKGGAK
ncbi:MAG: DUF4398 domain-containing protein, partial [Thermodesulfobacteriota bacterium]